MTFLTNSIYFVIFRHLACDFSPCSACPQIDLDRHYWHSVFLSAPVKHPFLFFFGSQLCFYNPNGFSNARMSHLVPPPCQTQGLLLSLNWPPVCGFVIVDQQSLATQRQIWHWLWKTLLFNRIILWTGSVNLFMGFLEGFCVFVGFPSRVSIPVA